MLTEIKLLQNTQWSLQCWQRTSLVLRRKTNANRNQTGTKYTLLLKYNAGIEPVSYSEEKKVLTEIKLVQKTQCSFQWWYRTSLVFSKKTNANRNQTGAKIHTGPYNAGIEPVWYSEEKQMPTRIKLVPNTHWSLQCWYRTNLVFRRKTNANRNQTGTKYTLLLTMLVQNRSCIQKKTNGNRNQTGTKYILYTPHLTMLVQNQSGIKKKTNANRSQTSWSKNTHWSLQCWYRISPKFR